MLTLTIMFFISLALGLGLYLGKMFHHPHRPCQTQEGSAFVNGRGHLSYHLQCNREPRFVTVNFADNHRSSGSHPCNPHHDWFDWEVEEREDGWVLKIYYHVNNFREIHYKAEF